METHDAVSTGRCERELRQLERRHGDQLRRFALNLTGSADAADNLASAVRLRMVTHRYRLPYVRNERAWLYRVLCHCFATCWERLHDPQCFEGLTDALLAERVRQAGALPAVARQITQRSAMQLPLRHFLPQVLDRLAPECRAAVHLQELADLPLTAISGQLRLPITTLRSLLVQERMRLLDELAVEEVVSPRLPARRRVVRHQRRRGEARGQRRGRSHWG